MKSVETYAPEFLLLIFLATVGVICLIFGELDLTNNLLNCEILMHLQLNEYETNPYFLQFFQSNTTVCLIIHVFCKSCEPEIVLPVLQIRTNFTFVTLTKHVNNQTNCRITLEILKKIWLGLVFI